MDLTDNYRRTKRELEVHTSFKRLFLVLGLVLILWFFGYDHLHYAKNRRILTPLENCLERKLAKFENEVGNMDTNIIHIPNPYPDEHPFLPYVGNGYLGLAIGAEAAINIRPHGGRILNLPVPFRPFVQALGMDQARHEEAAVSQYFSGSATKFILVEMDGGESMDISSSFVAHRTRTHPSVLEQIISINNLGRKPALVQFEQLGSISIGIATVVNHAHLIPSSPSTDSGNDSGDEIVRVSVSESDPIFLEEELEDLNMDLGNFSEEEQVVPVPKDPQPEEASSSGLNLDLNLNLDVNNIDTDEFFDFFLNNQNYESGVVSSSLAPRIEEELQGATALPQDAYEKTTSTNDAVAQLFDFGTLPEGEGDANDEEMEPSAWAAMEEELNLDFYKNFNEVANSELELEAAKSATDEAVELDDDWLECDSGVFDFLDSDSSAAERRRSSLNLDNISHPGSRSESEVGEGEEFNPSSSSRSSLSLEEDMIQAAPIHPNARPSNANRAFQVHARMPGLLRGGGSMDQRWQELANILSLQQQSNLNHHHHHLNQLDMGSGPLPPSLTHPFGPHPHHHPHLQPYHHHHPHFGAGPPPTGPSPAVATAPSAPYGSSAAEAPSARSVLLQNATLAGPPEAYTMGSNLGAAVSSSMHLTNTSDPMSDPSAHYKMIEPSHDMIYYPNASANNGGEMNNHGGSSSEGIFSSMLNDDDLQLMDMAMSEGLYTMRSMDTVGHPGAVAVTSNGGTSEVDRMEASSDSAVSSMGSERVPPMTDPSDEWVEPDSHPHSSHESSPYSLDTYSGGKGRSSYDYYGKGDRVPPSTSVAQKKHHMFGKRFQQDQGYGMLPPPGTLPYHPNGGLEGLDMKYGCGVEFARHQNDLRANGGLGALEGVHNNHTYSLPPNHPDNSHSTFKTPAPRQAKDKAKMNEDLDGFTEESISRDEKRARAMNLPITTDDIINLPMDEFNERLSKYDLSEPQLSLIRDIRRRGKNKVAAQNCRKRKLDQILQLADEVQRIRERKQSLLREQQELNARRHDLKDRYQLLYRHVFQALRDPEGQPYHPHDYSLQQAADGNIILVPRNGSHSDNNNILSSSSRRDKSKDDYNKKGDN